MKRDFRMMQRFIIALKNKILNIYLPLWIVLLCVAVCAAGAFLIGNNIGGRNNALPPQESVSSSDFGEDTTADSFSDIDKTQWNLILVNKWNKLPEDYSPELKELPNGHKIDERAYSDLQSMIDDCRKEGLDIVICSSYRTMDKQKSLYNNKIKEYTAQGYSQKDAEKAAGELVAIPGTSEHQLGLALDIVDKSNQLLDESQENTKVQKWLMQNSWKYGFILRYPPEKSHITGISYEPWHYRYVGKTAAKEIFDAQICLEEYLAEK